jgi:hypothetical protein
MIPLSSQWVLIRFSLCSPSSQCVPNMLSIVPHFYPVGFAKCCLPFTYIGGPKERNSILQNRIFYFGEPP